MLHFHVLDFKYHQIQFILWPEASICSMVPKAEARVHILPFYHCGTQTARKIHSSLVIIFILLYC